MALSQDVAMPSAADVIRTLTLQAGFNTSTVIIGTTLLGFAAGVIGVFALLRNRTMTADAISHATLPGIAGAFLVVAALGGIGASLPVLLVGAALSSVLGVVCINAILRFTRLREDAAIGIVLSVFFGAGVVGLTYIQNNAPDGAAGITGMLFGQAATLRPSDVAVIAGVSLVSLIAAGLFVKEITLVCFNDAFARVQGWPAGLIDLAMMGLVVLVTVAGLQAVGLVLVIALLVIPPVAARFWTDRLWALLAISAAIGALSGYLGAAVSALVPNKPAGAVIVLTASAIFVFSLIAAPTRGIAAATLRRARLRVRIACDHLLEAGAEAGDRDLRQRIIPAIAQHRNWSPLLRLVVLSSLRRSGYVDADSGSLVLTSKGAARGVRVGRNHALWEKYLITHADIAPSHVDWSVDQVEHVLPPSVIESIESALMADEAALRRTREAPSGRSA